MPHGADDSDLPRQRTLDDHRRDVDPFSILTSIICLSLFGQTLNVMTLLGLALAVGILVDDATVAIENISRNLQQGKELVRAIVDASEQIALPALVSTLSICIVFLPIFALSGPAAALFRPLAMSVIFAMLASYFLSRTLVPTMAKYMLREPDPHSARARVGSAARPMAFSVGSTPSAVATNRRWCGRCSTGAEYWR